VEALLPLSLDCPSPYLFAEPEWSFGTGAQRRGGCECSPRVEFGHEERDHRTLEQHMAIQDVPAPMTGTVKELLVSVGDRVSAGDELLIIESMKMEIPVESPVAGVLAEFVVEPPGKIEEGNLLLRLEV